LTLTIDLDAQTAALTAKARAPGLLPEQYARQLLENDLVPDRLNSSWQSSKELGLNQLSGEEIEAEIAAARKARRERVSQPGS